MNNALFSFRALISPMDNTPKKQRSLEELARYIDFARFRSILDKHCRHPKKSNAGRPPYDLLKMLKIIILQTLYNLSDEEMEFQLSDRISFMRFCGIDACDRIPDATTIWRFKESLGEKGTRELFEDFSHQMLEAGLEFSQGCIIDASFVEAPRQRNTPEENASIKETGKAPEDWSQAKKEQKDVDARWTKKGEVNYYGYKHHAIVDAVSKVITNQQTTSANVHDIVPLIELVEEGEEPKCLLADSAYSSQEKEELLADKNVKLYAVRKRTRGQDKLSDEDKAYNKAVSKVRCRVEHVFGAIKQMGGDYVRSIGLKRCKRFVNLVSLSYNMKRFAFLCRVGHLCPNR